MSLINFKRMGQLGSVVLNRFQFNVEQTFKQVNDCLADISTRLATSTSYGLIKKNKTRKVYLLSSVASNVTDFDTIGNNSDFKFDNLIVGQKYRLEFYAQMVRTSSSYRTSIFFSQDTSGTEMTTLLTRLYFNVAQTSTDTKYACQEFVAAADKIRVRQSWTNTCTFEGHATNSYTWMQLTEIENDEETSDWD